MEMCGVSIPSMNWESSNLPESWDKFVRHSKLVFSGPLKSKSEEEKVSYLLLWVGDKGRDIQHTWTNISDADAKKLDTYFHKYKEYVQAKLNPIFARFKFNAIVQGSDSVEQFVTKLKLAASDCQFGVSCEEMIRDRIVFATSSTRLREKLINVGEGLTLDRAVETAQTFEYSQEQLRTMTSMDGARGTSTDVDAIRRKQTHHKQQRQQNQQQSTRKTCGNCGTVLVASGGQRELFSSSQISTIENQFGTHIMDSLHFTKLTINDTMQVAVTIVKM